MADETEAGTTDTDTGVRLLLLENPGEMKALAREGWFKPIGPDRWRIYAIVHGRIRALMALASTYATPQMANVLALTPERVRQLTNEGVLKQIARHRYNRDDTTRDYIIWQRNQNKAADRTSSEARVREARAAEIEVRTAERIRRLIEIDEALDSNAILVGIVRTEFGGLAARITRDLVLRREIEKAVNEALTRIAARLVEEAASLETGRRADDAVADDAPGPVGEGEPQLPTNGGDPRPA